MTSDVEVKQFNWHAKKEKILRCPFCKCEVWFVNNQHGKAKFKYHVIREHLEEAVNFFAEKSVKEVMKSHLKWCVMQ